MKDKRIYIAYGSNLNLEQMAMRCPTAEIIGTGMIQNYELQFNRVATIVPKQGAEVPGLLWSLEPNDEKSLDRYEGYPNFYRKEMFELDFNDGKREGMIYIMNGGIIQVPSDLYYNTILQGYKDNGFNTSYLENARQVAIEHEEDEDMDELFGQMKF